MNEIIIEKAKHLNKKVIEIRNYLHENPELSSKEYETSKFLKSKMESLGFIVEDVPNSTGFTALLDTAKPGKTLGIRTDIDALPIQENKENLTKTRNVISKVDGVMHACGHDGHMSIVLAVAEILTEMKEQLSGKVYFIFEEGEEIGSGIDQMIEHLNDKKIDAIYGNHLASFLETGTISVDAGPKMAGAALVNFTVHGRGGHGSRPDLSINPVFAAANILTGITSAWTNQLDVTKTVTLGVTEIHGGSAMNVIADTVSVKGSLRFFDTEEGKKAVDVMKNVATHTARAHLCTVEFDEDFIVKTSPVINDETLANIAERGISEILPDSLKHNVPWFASESFHRYREIAPSCFTFVGIKNEEYGSGAEHHNEKFDLDVDALIYGVISTTKFAVDYLTSNTK